MLKNVTALSLGVMAVLAGTRNTAKVREHTFRLSTGDPAVAPGPMGYRRFA